MVVDLAIRNGALVTGEGITYADIGVAAGRIVALGEVPHAKEEVDASGLHVFPGVIDTQVHFREPGMEHKEDIESGTRAAVCGGVTTIFEMPNTDPPTTTAKALEDKLNRAQSRAWCDYAFFVGAAVDNVATLTELERLSGTPGVKIFVGSSTGSLLVPDDTTIEAVFRATRRRTPIHSEDHFRLEERKALLSESPSAHEHPFLRDAECARLATERLLRLSERTGHPIHILHLSTREEIPLIAEAKARGVDVTVEVTPQHLWFAAPECYDRLGTLAQMNPPVRSAEHRDALRQALRNNFFTVAGSDHAPHTLEEKALPYPKSPSGMPGVQTLLPAMLTLAQRDHLCSVSDVARLLSEAPAELYSLRNKGGIRLNRDADLVLVDLQAEWTFERHHVQSKCGWSPFEGETFVGRPIVTYVRGVEAAREGAPVGRPIGTMCTFA